MWVAVLRLDLSIPGARSLKDRRQVVKSLKERLAARYPVACSEVDDQESWVRASLGLAACANERGFLEELAEDLVRFASEHRGALLGHVARAIYRFEEGLPGGGFFPERADGEATEEDR